MQLLRFCVPLMPGVLTWRSWGLFFFSALLAAGADPDARSTDAADPVCPHSCHGPYSCNYGPHSCDHSCTRTSLARKETISAVLHLSPFVCSCKLTAFSFPGSQDSAARGPAASKAWTAVKRHPRAALESLARGSLRRISRGALRG